MKKLGETMEMFGFLGFLLSASGIDSGSKANIIALVISLGIIWGGYLLDLNFVSYENDIKPRRHHRWR